MSNRATSTATMTSTSTTTQLVPHEKIAMRAYEKWCKRGCPQGTDKQDWLEAEMELKSEMTRGMAGMQPATRR